MPEGRCCSAYRISRAKCNRADEERNDAGQENQPDRPSEGFHGRDTALRELVGMGAIR
jgi:hypothetical protein